MPRVRSLGREWRGASTTVVQLSVDRHCLHGEGKQAREFPQSAPVCERHGGMRNKEHPVVLRQYKGDARCVSKQAGRDRYGASVHVCAPREEGEEPVPVPTLHLPHT